VSGNPNLGIMRKFRRDTHELIMRGARLSADEVSALEVLVAAPGGERESRLALLGARIAGHAVKAVQVHWFIEHEPWTSLGIHGVVTMATGGPRERGVELWRTAVDTHRDDPRVIENAAWFFGMVDPPSGVHLVEDYCQRRQHDPEAWELMAVYFDFLSNSHPGEARSFASRSLEAAFRTFREESEPTRRLGLLPSMRAAANSAGQYDALRMLDQADKAHESGKPGDESTRQQALAVAAGFVALADANIEGAMSHLLTAVERVAASEAIHALARELASRGRRDEVRDLLQMTEARHAECARRLATWVAEFEEPTPKKRAP